MTVKKKSIKSDLDRLDAMKDEDIDYSDIPELDESFLKGFSSACFHMRSFNSPGTGNGPFP
jgi:hypothetical protein